MLENLKDINTKKESEMIDLNVKKIDICNNRQSAANTLIQNDMGKVQRLESNLVDSSESKCTASNKIDEDIVSSDMKVSEINTNYYVYALLDPRNKGNFKFGRFTFDFEPFYIGFGKKDRDLQHLKEAFIYNPTKRSPKLDKIRAIRSKSNKDYIPIRLYNNITKSSAKRLEIIIISIIGRLDQNKGPLTNLTRGGDGNQPVGSKNGMYGKGYLISGEKNGMYGVNRREAGYKKSQYWLGKTSPFKGVKNRYSEETLKQMSDIKKGKKQSEESNRKRSEALKGKPSPVKGMKFPNRKKSLKPAWNKGLTKETDERVKKYSNSKKKK
jgi:hypothetical protein